MARWRIPEKHSWDDKKAREIWQDLLDAATRVESETVPVSQGGPPGPGFRRGFKKVTQFTIERRNDPVTTWDTASSLPHTISGPEQVLITDQDGDDVHPVLYDILLEAVKNNRGMDELQHLLDRWNSGGFLKQQGFTESNHSVYISPNELSAGTDLTNHITSWDWEDTAKRMTEFGKAAGTTVDEITEATRQIQESMHKAYKPVGHKDRCMYVGSHSYACTCQPPTVWGRTLLWRCDCCEQPAAPVQYGLCAMCESHQYDPPWKAEAEHEVSLA